MSKRGSRKVRTTRGGASVPNPPIINPPPPTTDVPPPPTLPQHQEEGSGGGPGPGETGSGGVTDPLIFLQSPNLSVGGASSQTPSASLAGSGPASLGTGGESGDGETATKRKDRGKDRTSIYLPEDMAFILKYSESMEAIGCTCFARYM